MKVVYSFYSGPYAGDPATNPGNWSNPGVEFLIWAWSVLETRKWASKVELVTDDFGAALFDELGIEFDSVVTALNNVEPSGGKLWAIGKLEAYALQDEPFMHLDGDAWFATPPSDDILAYRLACQSKEDATPGSPYARCLREVLQGTDDVFPYRLFHAIGPRTPVASCLSVYVCNDLEFNLEYCTQARSFYDEWVAKKPGSFQDLQEWNIVVEQLMFGELCYQTYGFEPAYLLPTTKLDSRTNDIDFCHVWGAKRGNPANLQSLRRLRVDHPELYHRIAARFDLQRTLDRQLSKGTASHA
ncbi:MAG: DUF6734 family protein [Pirellulaceae bacterium]